MEINLNVNNLSDWLQFGISSFVQIAIACVAGWLAYLAYRGHKINTARRATIDLIEKTESSDHYRGLHKTFKKYRTHSEFHKLHNPGHEISEDRQNVLDFMNHYELVAIGIQNKILNEKIYSDWMGSPFVRDWLAIQDFVDRERWKERLSDGSLRYHQPLFEHFNKLACKWDSTGKVKILTEENSTQKPEEAEGPGDEPLPPVSSNKDEC